MIDVGIRFLAIGLRLLVEMWHDGITDWREAYP